MKNYILMSGYVNETVVSRFAFMKKDWCSLTEEQQVGCILKMVSHLSITEAQRNDIVSLATGKKDSIDWCASALRVTRTSNMVEIKLVYINTKYPVMVDATDEEYRHYVEDAQDEAEK